MTRMKLSSCAIPGTAAYDRVSARNGQTYRIFVHAPAGEPPAEGWPVLYLTDGNAVIGTAVEAIRAQAGYPTGTNVAPGVIVAIGYPTDDAYDPLRRSWDLSPLPGKTYPPFFSDGPDVKTGGGEEFLGFIEEDVKPFVYSLARIDPTRQSLFGHSFGGLFALYAFFTRPHAFRNWIAASPAIFWDDGLILQYRDRFLAALPPELDTFLHFSAGEYEGDDLAPFQRQAEDAGSRLKEKTKTRTIGHARELSAELAALEKGSIRTHYETFPYETHMSVLPVAVGRAVQIAFAIKPLGYLCENIT